MMGSFCKNRISVLYQFEFSRTVPVKPEFLRELLSVIWVYWSFENPSL